MTRNEAEESLNKIKATILDFRELIESDPAYAETLDMQNDLIVCERAREAMEFWLKHNEF